MSGTAFEEFARAMAAPGPDERITAPRAFDRVTILGGREDARLLAALALAAGAEVTLFSAYGAELDALRTAGGISLRGDGPVGTYQVDQPGIPSIATTAELDHAVSAAELVFLTGPVHKQRTYAMVLAEHLRDGQVLVLAPGRSLGAAEVAWLLRAGGCRADYTLVETQGLAYWTRAAGGTLNLSACAPVAAATLPSGRVDVLNGLARFLPNLEPVSSTVQSGFADGSGIVEVPALLMGGPALPDGRPTVPMGGVPLPENDTFRALIGGRHLAVMERLAQERGRVAARFGVRDLPSVEQWLDVHAGTASGAGSRPVPDEAQASALIRCAVIGSLVPLVSAARVCRTPVPHTEALVTLASSVLGADLAPAGRRLEMIGIDTHEVDDARRILDDIARGAR